MISLLGKNSRQAGRARKPSVLGAATAGLLALAACDSGRRSGGDALAAAPAQTEFTRPPRVLAVVQTPGGGASLRGLAAPDSRIRAVTTSEDSYGATAGRDGRFTLELPPAGRTRLVALSMEGPGRSTRASGWLFVPPDAPRSAVVLNAGAAAEPLAGADLLAAVDFDAGGGVAVSGRASPNETLSVSLDNAPGQEAHADGSGLWSLRLTVVAPPGAHVLRVRGKTRTAERSLTLSARKITGLFQAVREAGDWRIDWTPPGGGEQTTLVLMGGPS